LLDALAAVFFPTHCVVCQTLVESISDGAVCPACWAAIRPFGPIVCARCGYGFASAIVPAGHPLCGSCRRQLFDFDFSRACAPFEDPLKEIIHHFKYRSRRGLARPLAQRLVEAFQVHAEEFDVELVLPVPLHKSRQRERGFNQALELARHFCREVKLPLEASLIERIRPTKIQAGLSRRERRMNVEGAFQLTQPRKADGRKILLLDDVFTTGATLNECAKILKRAGASRVCVLTLARVIR
jgi:ComF family protein